MGAECTEIPVIPDWTGDISWIPLKGFCDEPQNSSLTDHLELSETAKQIEKITWTFPLNFELG